MIDLGIPGLEVSDSGEVVKDDRGLSSIVYDDPRITAIGENAFSDQMIQSIKAPYVQYIKENAFRRCKLLHSAEFPQAREIGEGAFANCYALKSFEVATTVGSIGASAFENSGLVNVDLRGKNLSRIENDAFAECHHLETIALTPFSALTYIGDGAFKNCYKLKSPAYWPALKYIGDWAFFYSSLTDFKPEPGNGLSIGKAAFALCGKLVDIELPADTSYVGQGAFSLCGGRHNGTRIAFIKCSSPKVAEWDAETSQKNELWSGDCIVVRGGSVKDFIKEKALLAQTAANDAYSALLRIAQRYYDKTSHADAKEALGIAEVEVMGLERKPDSVLITLPEGLRFGVALRLKDIPAELCLLKPYPPTGALSDIGRARNVLGSVEAGRHVKDEMGAAKDEVAFIRYSETALPSGSMYTPWLVVWAEV